MALVGKSQGMRQLGKPRRRLREILKWVLKNWIRISGLDSFKSFFFQIISHNVAICPKIFSNRSDKSLLLACTKYIQ